METIKLDYVDIFDGNSSKSVVFSKHLISEPFNEKSLFVNIVDGESMQPVINDRALIIADLSKKELVNNSIYLVYCEDKMWVKKYDGENELFFSINAKFSHLVYKESDVHVVAKVVLTFTNL